ncbi:hypothetical protein [Stenomitos frigidus]|uniref:Uncharacterized protein n=1 Tax=Stenomitos frigidus ULC18 TaxID=2107698 RepID=A0A2T1ECV8_9CYAN|nr:hypothetical protein C7B82_08810 [Stenomitos frigidus ULC18]
MANSIKTVNVHIEVQCFDCFKAAGALRSGLQLFNTSGSQKAIKIKKQTRHKPTVKKSIIVHTLFHQT